MTTNKSYTMIVDTVHGGIGHKAISLYYTITYALLLGRNLRSETPYSSSLLVHMDPIYWKHLNSCFAPLRDDQRNSLAFHPI